MFDMRSSAVNSPQDTQPVIELSHLHTSTEVEIIAPLAAS